MEWDRHLSTKFHRILPSKEAQLPSQSLVVVFVFVFAVGVVAVVGVVIVFIVVVVAYHMLSVTILLMFFGHERGRLRRQSRKSRRRGGLWGGTE